MTPEETEANRLINSHWKFTDCDYKLSVNHALITANEILNNTYKIIFYKEVAKILENKLNKI